MPKEIVARILRVPGYGVYAWEADEAASTLTLSIRPTGGAADYICGGRAPGCRICVPKASACPSRSATT